MIEYNKKNNQLVIITRKDIKYINIEDGREKFEYKCILLLNYKSYFRIN